jgi:hypothetical protein
VQNKKIKMSIGKLNEFNVSNAAWSSYMDRVEMYFQVNYVDDSMKVPVLIAAMGDEAYELLETLASPTKPAQLTLAQIHELMSQHLQPAPSVLAERYRFRQRRQGVGESVSTYVAELKRLSKHCKFGSNLNEDLRDQFVCGLSSDIMRQRLFAEDDKVTFMAAVKLATSLEAAERDAAIVQQAKSAGSSGTGETQTVMFASRGRSNTLDGAQARTPVISSQRRNFNGRDKYCEACGARSHNSANCKFRDYVCSKCQRTGHLRRVCPDWGAGAGDGRGRARGPARRGGPAAAAPTRSGMYFGDADRGFSEESGGDIEEDLHHLCLNNYQSVSLPIQIDKTVMHMQVDTGTAISCVNKITYDKCFSHMEIVSDNTVLKFYDGSTIKPLGIIRPMVTYNGCSKPLELFVIEGGTTSLLGRQWLAELNIDIPKFNCNFVVNESGGQISNEVVALLSRYEELFSDGLGRYRGGKAKLRVRSEAAPVFHRARPLPYALRERVDAELDGMLRAGVIEPVDCSDWASPLVPINKPDGSLRICADYKTTLNPHLLVDRYPLPKIEDVLVNLNGNMYFSKIDLSQAYNQIELDESKRYTVVNTHRGLFQYNRLVYGLSSSVGIFQRIMINLLGNIPNVQIFLDDVIIGGKNKSEHLQALQAVFQRLVDNGLKLKKSKCVFLAKEVTYLGYVVSREGIKPDTSKINAIMNMAQPRNVSELRSFLGTVNFFGRFIKSLSIVLSPLYYLLKKGVDWHWNKGCTESFTQVKRLLSGAKVLSHYDPAKRLIATCDASPRGVGAILTQVGPDGERPVAYASRTLNNAEANYSQIHREALAIIFCVKKFHQYLYGRQFTLRTDHKPLVSIFGPNTGIPTMTASRMQRWAIILSAYNYNIEYVNTKDNCADGLSRLPSTTESSNSSYDRIPEQTYLHFAQDALLLDYNKIKSDTSRDPVLARVLSFVRDGWPESCDIEGLRPYFNRKTELYEELGCVMWGHRVVIPEACRGKVLRILHEPHMGIVKTKALARSYVWWAGIDEAVEATCRGCAPCATLAAAPPRHAPRCWPWPTRAWTRVHIDFLGPLYGKMYLILVDAMSKWVEVFQVPSTAAGSTLEKLSEVWARWGIPKQVVSDNGPPFTSTQFSSFLALDGVEHIFTAPYHPASNGAAENSVKVIKQVIKKAVIEKTDVAKSINTFLIYYRNTPHCSTGESPAGLMMGRQLRTRLDLLKPDVGSRVARCQQKQSSSVGGSQRQVIVGDDVWYRKYLKGEKWQPGKVTKVLGETDYNVSDSDGNVIHRHIDQLRRRTRSSIVCPIGNREITEATGGQSPRVHSRSSGSERPADTTSPTFDASPGRSTAPGDDDGLECFSTPGKGDGTGDEQTQQPSPSLVPSRSRPIRQCRMKKPLYKL